MRPSLKLFIALIVILSLDAVLFLHYAGRKAYEKGTLEQNEIAVAALGLSDLCVSTEARYTRHPAVSDPLAPFMDHPGAIEHFPTGSFWTPIFSAENR